MLDALKARRSQTAGESPWLTVPQAAEYLGVGTDLIYVACQQGLKHSKLGSATIRTRREWLDDWAESRAQQKANDAQKRRRPDE